MPTISKLLYGELERFQESVHPSMASLPIVNLAYLHVILLIRFYTPSVGPQDLLDPAQQMINILKSSTLPVSPLGQHFITLASLNLIGLVDSIETIDEACADLHTLMEILNEPRTSLDGWNESILSVVRRKQRHYQQASAPPARSKGRRTAHLGSLHHLGDLAVHGERRGSSSKAVGADPAIRVDSSSPSSSPQPASASSVVLDASILSRIGYLTALVRENR